MAVRSGNLTNDELGALITKGEIDTVIVAFCDMQGRLVGKRTDDAETVFARNVGGREDTNHAGVLVCPAVEIAEGEAGVIMRRADHQHGKRIGREGIAAEFLSPGHLWHTVEPDGRRAYGIARNWHSTVKAEIERMTFALLLTLSP